MSLLEKFIQWRSKFCPIVIWFIFYIHNLDNIFPPFLFFLKKKKKTKKEIIMEERYEENST